MNELVECPKCGWVHFAVDEAYVKNWEKEWQRYYQTWSKERLSAYGVTDATQPTREQYLQCFRCGNKDTQVFFLTKKDIYGHTIQPILWENECEK